MFIENYKDLLKIYRLIWKFVGLIRPESFRTLYSIWTVVLNVSVTFFYPFHLFLGLFDAHTEHDIFKILGVLFTDMQCSIKFIVIWCNLENIWLAEDLFSNLDKRIQAKDESWHLRKVIKSCKGILYTTAVLYGSYYIMLSIAPLLGAERHLIYPAWLPIDWNKSLTNYSLVYMYQSVGVGIQILINLASDTYPAISLATLSGHIQILSMRVSKLGTDSSKSRKDNNKELRMCLQDHQRLIEIHNALQKVLSKGMFCQILGTGLTVCCNIIYMNFFAENALYFLYYSVLVLILPLEIFPSCYFGSVFEIEFSNFSYAAFSCNWIDQDKEFKQNILILSQRSYQRTSFFCMGFFRIHLDSFYFTMRSAYSLLAVIIQVK